MGKNSGQNQQQETMQQLALAEVAISQWNRYQDVFVPFSNKYLADATGMNIEAGKVDQGRTKIQQDRVAGQINASMAQAVQSTPPAGFDPSRSSFVAGTETPALAKTAAKAQVKGAQSVKDRQIDAMMSAVNLGRGQADDTQVTMGGLASQSVESAIDEARSRRATQDAMSSGVMTAVGAGAGLVKN